MTSSRTFSYCLMSWLWWLSLSRLPTLYFPSFSHFWDLSESSSFSSLLIFCIAFWSFFYCCCWVEVCWQYGQITDRFLSMTSCCLWIRPGINRRTADAQSWGEKAFWINITFLLLLEELEGSACCLDAQFNRRHARPVYSRSPAASLIETLISSRYVSHYNTRHWIWAMKATQVFHYASEPRSSTSDRTPVVSSNSGCVAWGAVTTSETLNQSLAGFSGLFQPGARWWMTGNSSLSVEDEC